MIEDHYIHARILIEFLFKTLDKARDNDVIACDYFYEQPGIYNPIQERFLTDQAQIIGNHLVHITEVPMPDLISDAEFPTEEIANRLLPFIRGFIVAVPQNKIADGFRKNCQDLLSTITPRRIPVSDNRTT